MALGFWCPWFKGYLVGGMEAQIERFERQKDALEWLHGHFGRTFPSAGKFSMDCRDGACVVQLDKSIRLKDLRSYAERLSFNKRAASASASLAERKEELEIRKRELEIDKLEREKRAEDERWMLKEDAWAQMAALVGTLRDALRHHFHLGQNHLMHLAGADPSRGPELYEGVEEIMARSFNEVVRSGRVDVVLEKGEE